MKNAKPFFLAISLVTLAVGVPNLVGQSPDGAPPASEPAAPETPDRPGSPSDTPSPDDDSRGGSLLSGLSGLMPGGDPSGSGNSGARDSRSLPGDAGGLGHVLSAFQMEGSALDWRGTQFHLGDVAAVRARFEKYLSSPPSDSDEDLAYDALLEKISRRLIGEGGGHDQVRVSEAWRMLYQASAFPMDAGLSETLADRVVSFWQTNRKVAALDLQNEQLAQDREYREMKIRTIEERDRREFIDLTRGQAAKGAPPPPSLDHQSEPERKRLERIEAKMDENEQFEAVARINQKLEFQSLVVQFFMQRRFQHALIANDFYRYMFDAEENVLEGADALKGQMFGDLDVKITTSTLDALAKEAIADAESSLETVGFLLEQDEVHQAAQRLMEAFFLGEYLPAVKRFPLARKRRIGQYLRDVVALANALDVKSFERAEDKLNAIEAYATDFDGGKARAYIDTSRQLSNLAVQRALAAAHAEDRDAVDQSLSEAVRYWPTNPKIEAFTDKMLEQTDLQQLAARDFDRLLNQENYRAIFEDRFKFAGALAADPERSETFEGLMRRMETIETALAQARELVRVDNAFGAWEILERVYRQYPEDPELSRRRGDLAVKASSFAAVISRADDARSANRFGEALMTYLRAIDVYPASRFARDGIEAVVEAYLDQQEGPSGQGAVVAAKGS
ncbi:MAG: hypothetical protein ACFE0O_14415 [Opitutales bacterium]